MKTLLMLSLAFLFTAATAAVYNYTSDSITGDWYSDKKESVIRIEKRDGKYYGKLVWLQEPNVNGQPKKDDHNPDEKLRSQTILGLTIIRDLEYDEDNEWEDGAIYDPRSGKTYSCEATLEDMNTLHLRGYLGISLIGKTTVWTRKQ